MDCEIKCGVPKSNPLHLKKKGQPEVTWFTKDKGVTYCVHIPARCLCGMQGEQRL